MNNIYETIKLNNNYFLHRNDEIKVYFLVFFHMTKQDKK